MTPHMPPHTKRPHALALLIATLAATQAAAKTDAEIGFENISTKAYSAVFMEAGVFEKLWQSWDDASRKAAENATPEEREARTYERYGLVRAPFANGGYPLGLTPDQNGSAHMNCMICHSGTVDGKVNYGRPNELIDMQSFMDDIAKTRAIMQLPPMPPAPLPYNNVAGVPRAMEGTAFMLAFFDNELNFFPPIPGAPPRMPNYDVMPQLSGLHEVHSVAPAWWGVHSKQTLYWTGEVGRNSRFSMIGYLNPFNPAEFKEKEEEHKQIYKWIESLEAPKYQGKINPVLAGRGKSLFERNCASCHGTYGAEPSYPNLVIPVAAVGTDPRRAANLPDGFRVFLRDSWLGRDGKDTVRIKTDGYQAPHLAGVWATAPYFHNGSVPTLREVLFPEERPVVWKANGNAYDHARVGMDVERLTEVPSSVELAHQKRRYYDTRALGMSNQGHPFVSSLKTAVEKNAVLEYLKTL